MADPTTSQKAPRNIAARVLAPLALVAVTVAVVTIVSSADTGSDGRGGGRDRGERVEQREPKFKDDVYVVEPGDTLTSIADKTGVSIAAIEQLNPDLDTQILTSGQEIKLR